VNAFLAGDKQNKNQQTEKLRNWEEEADISQYIYWSMQEMKVKRKRGSIEADV